MKKKKKLEGVVVSPDDSYETIFKKFNRNKESKKTRHNCRRNG